jgi:nickel/cobalt transporter (NicO) family protein
MKSTRSAGMGGFARSGRLLESTEECPHEFMAHLSLGHAGYVHEYDLSFVEDHDHGHDHRHEKLSGLDLATGDYQDTYELAHTNDIRRRFADKNAMTGQIVKFGCIRASSSSRTRRQGRAAPALA